MEEMNVLNAAESTKREETDIQNVQVNNILPDLTPPEGLPEPEEELGAMPSVTLKEGFDGIDLSCWGVGVKPEHLETYGWKAVSEVHIPKEDKVYVRKPTLTYPIFAQECPYVDGQGQPQVFYKVYEPKNPDKAHRFLIAGRKPNDYIYGLSAVRRFYEENDE